MGQESGRAAWPRPAGGYQTITGRRYGRRHAFISFRPSFKASGRYRTQNPARVENYGGAARENLSRQQHIAPKSALSTMLRTILPVPNSVHPELRGRTGRDSVGKKQPSIRRLAEGATIQYKKLKTDPKVISEPRNDGCEESEKTKESTSWSETEECLTNGALGFVSIDAYEPDSSGGEEEEEESAGMSEQQEPPVGQQRRLDDMIFELGKDFDYLRGLHSFLYTKTDQPSKDSTETDCGTGLNPEGCDAERRLEEWPVNGAVETNDRCGAEEEEEDSAAAAGSAAETECRTRTVSIESRAEVGDQVEVWDEPGPLTGQTLAPPAFQDPSEASAVSPYCPLCPATGSGERGGGASTTETEWRHAGGWQNLGGNQDGGVWGSEDRGAGLDPGAVAGSSASNGEQVVRPKIRKQSSETHLEQERGPDPLPAHCGSSARANRPTRTSTQAKCVSAPPFFLTQTDRPNPELLFSFPQAERMREEEERMREWLERRTEGLRRRRRREDEWRRDERRKEEESCRLDSDEDADDDIWEDLEVFNDKMAPFIKAEECSECSEGEWFWPSDSGLDKERRSSEEESSGGGSSKEDKGSHEGSWEKNRRSSEESWETLPGLEEISSTSSSLEETAPLSTDTGTSQPQLEEGEVPWLMYNQEASSSEDEEGPDPGSHFVHPGLFILDGNNNLDDDSSMSEDLDAEWRLLDDFGEGFGMAQAISYVDPQLLTYMALEERLAQAMEAALAHLESLAIDVEQAHPPATEQIIDCLPHITIQEEHSGQEQCCAICCSEYVREEVATQLPCNHMFHKLCVTLWLQKSGTCPVCRHILTPPLPEAPPPTSFLSDQEVPPSNHSTAGTR